MDFVGCQRIHDEVHAHPSVGCVFRVRKLLHQLRKGLKSLARGFLVSFGNFLPCQPAEKTEVVVEIHHPAQV